MFVTSVLTLASYTYVDPSNYLSHPLLLKGWLRWVSSCLRSHLAMVGAPHASETGQAPPQSPEQQHHRPSPCRRLPPGSHPGRCLQTKRRNLPDMNKAPPPAHTTAGHYSRDSCMQFEQLQCNPFLIFKGSVTFLCDPNPRSMFVLSCKRKPLQT